MQKAIELNSDIDSGKRLIITFAVMCVSVMELLDMTIINVALPDMMGALGVDVSQITWIMTTYIVAASVMMPLTGFLITRMGIKKVLMSNIIGFGLSSLICGLAQNFTIIIIFRFLQGAFGAALVPISQTVLRTIYPKDQQGKAMAIWGVGIMVAPVLGPTIGGYITQLLSWRWTFFVNVPVCFLAFFMVVKHIHSPEGKKVFIDKLGIALMAIWVMCLQMFLDQGDNKGWFDSLEILIFFVTFIITFILFIIHGLTYEKSIINLRLFKDRNFGVACLIITTFGIGLFGGMVPGVLLLQNLLGYPVITTGELSAPQGLASATAMIIVGRLVNVVDNRKLVMFGVLCTALGSYIKTYYNLDISTWFIIWPQIIMGIGMGFFFVPLATIAYNTIPAEKVGEAAGLFSFCRNVGNSVGVAITTTILSRTMQINWQQLGENINPNNPAIQKWLFESGYKTLNINSLSLLKYQLQRQAQMIAFIDVFYFVSICFILLFPLLFLIKKSSTK